MASNPGEQQKETKAKSLPGGSAVTRWGLALAALFLFIGAGLFTGLFERIEMPDGSSSEKPGAARYSRLPADASVVTFDSHSASGVDTGVIVQPGETIEIREVGSGKLTGLARPPYPWDYWVVWTGNGGFVKTAGYAFPIWGAEGQQYAPGWIERYPFAHCGAPPFAVVLVLGNPLSNPEENPPCERVFPLLGESTVIPSPIQETSRAYLAFNDATHYWVRGQEIFLEDPGGGATLVKGYQDNIGTVELAIIKQK